MTAGRRRKLSDQLLTALETASAGQRQAVLGSHFEDFWELEALLVAMYAPGADRIDAAWLKMRPADVARWKAGVMFGKVVTQLEVSAS
jgi:hypothetical protein